MADEKPKSPTTALQRARTLSNPGRVGKSFLRVTSPNSLGGFTNRIESLRESGGGMMAAEDLTGVLEEALFGQRLTPAPRYQDIHLSSDAAYTKAARRRLK